jgi:hypothetical protein
MQLRAGSAVTAGAEVRQQRLGGREQAADVDLELLSHLVHRRWLQGAVRAITCVVDQGVDAPEPDDPSLDGRFDRLGVLDVEAGDEHVVACDEFFSTDGSRIAATTFQPRA